jgi:structural maintenance of chromosome 2
VYTTLVAEEEEEAAAEGEAGSGSSPSRRRQKKKKPARFDPATAAAELDATERAAASASRGVNRRVLQMFDKAEAEFRELNEKKEIVQRDRAKIERVIAELDEKKRDALTKTWEKVDVDFGTIFSTLLPGTRARLVPPEGAASFLEAGLEVRVAFGEVWKESLTELSGGQRSLLALSLILAMLLFKPAPIYILDEVDAALDLSHTQNVGRMIRRHFPYSQFLIVSLKEGMFANANVIFRTRFADGVSGVVRTENASAGVEEENERRAAVEGEEGAAAAVAGKAAVAGAPTATVSAAGTAGKGNAATPLRAALEDANGR